MTREEYIRIYRSDVAGAIPSSLTSGEIAANLVDGKLFIGGTNGSLIQFTTDSYSVTGVNGLTGNVSLTGDGAAIIGKDNAFITARLADTSTTGVASFKSNFFSVSNGEVSLAQPYSVVGVTGIGFGNDVGLTGKINLTAGSGVTITRAGNTITIDVGVTTGAISTSNVLIPTHSAVKTYVDDQDRNVEAYVDSQIDGVVGTIPLAGATSGVTGIASFNPNRFQVSVTGNVDLLAAYQVTGDTVQAGSAINIGAGKTINNIGVTAFNGLTGSVSLTGDGGAVYGVSNNTIAARVAGYSATGFAAFNSTFFDVGSTGLVSLTGVYVDANGVSGSLQSLSYHEGATSSISLSIPVRTNLIKHTQDYVNLGETDLWNAYGNDNVPTITNLENVAIHNWPNGSTGGIQLVFANNNNNGIYQKWPTNTLQTNTIYTVSCWAKSSSDTEKARFSYYDGDAMVSYFSKDFTLTIVPQRVSYTFRTRSNHADSNIAFGNGSGNATGTVLAWGFQLEQGSVPTSLIPNSTGEAKQGNAQLVSIDLTNRIASATITGVASFDPLHFNIGSSGHVRSKGVITINSQSPDSNGNFTVAAATVVTGDGGVIQGKGDAFITARVATDSLTGVASFNSTYFSVAGTGAVSLATAYQVTGHTVVAGYGIDLVSSGNTRTINNRGVTSFNGLTGNVSLTGDGGAVQGKLNNSITVRVVADNAMTGIASFDASHFAVASTGHVRSKGVITINSQPPDSNGNFTVAAATVVTGDGGAIQGKGDAFITARVSGYGSTGVASFNPNDFVVGSTGQVGLTGNVARKNIDNAFTVGQTISGNLIVGNDGTIASDSNSANQTIYLRGLQGDIFLNTSNIGDTQKLVFTPVGNSIITLPGASGTVALTKTTVSSVNGLTGAVTIAGTGAIVRTNASGNISNIDARLSSTSLTGVASFNNVQFTVDTTGHVKLADAYQVTGDTVQAGSAINIGAGKTINNIGVTAFNGLTGNVSLTGDGGAIQGRGNAFITARLASASVTGVASFDPVYFAIGTSGHLKLALGYQATGDNSRIASGTLTGVASFDPLHFNIGSSGHVRSKGVITINSQPPDSNGNFTVAAATVVTGDGGAIQGKLNTTITARHTTSVIVTSNGIPLGAPGEGSTLIDYNTYSESGMSHGETGVGYFDIAHFIVKPQYGLVQLRNPAFTDSSNTLKFTGLGATGPADGSLSYYYFDIGNLTTANNTTIDSTADGIVFYDASESNLIKTKKITPKQFLLDNDIIFSSKSTQLVRSKGSDTIDFELVTAEITANATGLLKAGDAYNYITQNTVNGFNGVTGAIFYSPVIATTSLTGVASFNNVQFTVDTTGHVKLADAYQVTGDTIVAGYGIDLVSSGNTRTINNRGVTSFNGLTGNVSLTGDGGAVQGRGNAFITARLASASVTGVAAFNDAHFSINEETGLVGLINPYDPDRPAFNPNDFVVGSTGSVSLTGNVARTNTAQTFSGLQTFSNGISGVGATFSGNITLGSAATDTSTIYGTKIINEGIYNNGSLRTANINFNNGQVQTLTGVGTGATGVTAIYFTGAPSTGAASVTLLITNGGQMTGDGMTGWGGNIKWPGGIKPVLTTSGIDVVSFVTPDAGTTIYGFVGGLNFA